MIEFPLRLESELSEFTVAEGLHIRRMDDANGTQARVNSHLGNALTQEAMTVDIDKNMKFGVSNYILTTPTRERAVEFNLALKLVGNSTSSIYIGYEPNGSLHFVYPSYFTQGLGLTVTEEVVERLSSLVEKIAQARGDEKLLTMADYYLHALSADVRRPSRFVDLVIIMEMLLLPNDEQELSYRFSLRFAKFMKMYFDKPIVESFEHAQDIYKIRSKLVHKGSHPKLIAYMPVAINYARILLAAYLDDKTRFGQKNLNEICLA